MFRRASCLLSSLQLLLTKEFRKGYRYHTTSMSRMGSFAPTPPDFTASGSFPRCEGKGLVSFAG
jgi:hypothetical protein